jgi:pimeloyl-ACP methyl ester carboxylesterase
MSPPPQTPYSRFLENRDPLKSLEDTGEQIARLASAFTPQQLEHSYAPGKWSARQLVLHLVHVHVVNANRIRTALATPGATVTPFVQDRWLERESDVPADAALPAYIALSALNRRLFATLAPAERAVRIQHPEFGEIDVNWLIHALAGHEIDHLEHLQRISQATMDVDLAYEEAGDRNSKDVLLLIHGHPFNRSMWRPQIDAASRAGWRVIAPDLRGYGESPVVPGIATLDVLADDIFRLLDRLGVEGVVVAGLSMGGQIAMECARSHGDRVRALVLAATFPQPETDEGKATRRATAERLLREGMTPYAKGVLEKMIAPHNVKSLPEVAAHVMQMMTSTAPEGAAAALRGRGERPAYEETLASFDRPALVVVGDCDAFTTRADADQMHRLLKHSRLEWMEGVGHMPNLERAEEFNTALLDFLHSLRAA